MLNEETKRNYMPLNNLNLGDIFSIEEQNEEIYKKEIKLEKKTRRRQRSYGLLKEQLRLYNSLPSRYGR